MSSPVISVSRLKRSFKSGTGEVTVLKDISLAVPQGEFVAVMGASGSGKSTVAIALERELHKCGLLCRILDGDNIRSGINNNLGFSAEDRVENIRRIAEVSKLFIDTGVITIAAFISPNNDLREMAASIVGKENFLEIYVLSLIHI